MEEESARKWEQLIEMMSEGNEVSLGECIVTATMVEGSVAIVISNMFGLGFDMVMPTVLPDEVKESLIAMTESSDIDPVSFSEESVKKNFITGYINSLLPEITEELREMVSDIEPFRAVLCIMSYLNLFEWSMENGETEIVTLGPDGNIYVDAEEMPFSSVEISDQMMRISGLPEDEVALMKRWIPAAAKVFDGVFPGYLCEDDGVGAKITLLSMEMSRSFSLTVEDFWGEGPGDESEMSIDSIIDMVKRNIVSSNRTVSKKPVEDALDMMVLDGLTNKEKDALRTTLLNVYAACGEVVKFSEAIPDIGSEGVSRIMERICESGMVNEEFPFECRDGGIVYIS